MTWEFKKNNGVQPCAADTKVDVEFNDGANLTICAGDYSWSTEDIYPIVSWRLHDHSAADNALINHGENKSQVDTENNDIPNLSTNWDRRKRNRVDAGAHYRFEYQGIKLDPFRICEIYNITSLGQGTIVKKGLRLGTSIKDKRQDLIDIRSAVDRMLEMMDEDE